MDLNSTLKEDLKKLYEINNDPKRKKFLDELFAFMQEKGTPITRLPVMAKSVLDLYELYKLVVARGGLVEVINKKLWQEIIKGLHMPQSITSAAFTLRTQYMKFIYAFECHKHNFSTQQALDSAIDGNKREGRRSGYQMHMAQQTLSANPLALVTNANHQQIAQAQAAQVQAQVQAQAQCQRLFSLGPPPSVELLKLFLATNRNLAASYSAATNSSAFNAWDTLPEDVKREMMLYMQHNNNTSSLSNIFQRQHSRSPPQGTAVRSPPTSTAVSGAFNGAASEMLNGAMNNGFAESHGHEPYSDSSSEALNLANSALNVPTAQKRGRDDDESTTSVATSEDLHANPAKRVSNGQLWQTSLYNSIANLNNNNNIIKNMNAKHETNGERDNDSNDDGDDTEGNHCPGSYITQDMAMTMMRQYNDFSAMHPLQQQQLAQQQLVQRELEANLELQQASPQRSNEPTIPEQPLEIQPESSSSRSHRKSDSALEDSPASVGNVSPATSAPKDESTPCRCANNCVCKDEIKPEMAIFAAAMAIVQNGHNSSLQVQANAAVDLLRRSLAKIEERLVQEGFNLV